jgi:trimeric autotransporter adhesin
MKNIFYSTLLLFITLPASEFILHYTSTENVNDYAGNGVTATTVKSENPKNAYCLDATGEAFTNGPCTNVTVTVTTPVICAGSNDTLMASGATTYTWSPSTALNTTTGATVIANPTATTIYTVTGTYGEAVLLLRQIQ